MSVNPIAAVGTGASAPPTPAADVGASQTFDVLPEGVAPMQAERFRGREEPSTRWYRPSIP